ncbi:10266_t:CDS:2 [Funneliformis caledonium]|uniref:10266_t:CDS:1 n=1 Tax=Funneliformis caledonium TaxID=1117310 RepID=A0A9N9ATR4_9GLOM|nr:10266_t:CDS:2 [Funneliformis caledonium]
MPKHIECNVKEVNPRMKKRHIKLEEQLKNHEEYNQLSISSSEEEQIYQSADDERLVFEEEKPIDDEEFYLNESDRVPYDYFSAPNLNDIDTNLNSEHINTSANFDDL